MSTLSEQVRALVDKSPMSTYAIAKEAGIDKSTMSRFMNGGSLSLEKFDRLAQVLGIQIASSVAAVRKLPMGRPSKRRENRKSEPTVLSAKKVCEACAKRAHEQNLESRRGIYAIGDEGPLVFYNNNPYQSVPKAREKEIARIKKRLRDIGIPTLAQASYGDKLHGTKELYTVALLFDCDEARKVEVQNVILEETAKTFKENF